MTPSRHALLIGSGFDGLPGTENDVEAMARILEGYGFSQGCIIKLCHADATRDRIVKEWEALATESIEGDVMVIYYSGHGGLAEDKTQKARGLKVIQFLVPYDFDDSLRTWKGIADFELSELLRKATLRTRNVTYILDCCHVHRMGRREPAMAGGKLKSLSQSNHTKIW